MDAATVGRRSCVVIADIAAADGEPSQRLGMLVDAVFEVVDSPADALEQVPRLGTRIDASFIRSMVRVRGQAMPELDVDAILDQRTLAGLIEQHAGVH